MAKFELDIEYDFDFYLLGIASHLPDYRLCWSINKQLDLNLAKSDKPLKILQKDKLNVVSFDVFCGIDEDLQAEFNMIDNICEGMRLIPEVKQADYLLLIRGLSAADCKAVQLKINRIEQVLTAFPINVTELKSKEKLLF